MLVKAPEVVRDCNKGDTYLDCQNLSLKVFCKLKHVFLAKCWVIKRCDSKQFFTSRKNNFIIKVLLLYIIKVGKVGFWSKWLY